MRAATTSFILHCIDCILERPLETIDKYTMNLSKVSIHHTNCICERLLAINMIELGILISRMGLLCSIFTPVLLTTFSGRHY